MPTSIRLDPDLERALEALARQRGQSKSAVIRTALTEFLSRHGGTPSSRVADLVGSVSGGPDELSERTGERLRQLLARRWERRAPKP